MRAKNLTPGFALLQFLYMTGFAAIIPYTSLFLLSRGMSNTETGLVISLGNILALLLQPLAGTLMDFYPRLNSRRVLLTYWTLSILLGLLLLLWPVQTPAMTGVLFVLLICLLQSALSMANILGMESMSVSPGLNFGVGRAAGSLGYAVAAWATGLLAATLPPMIILIVLLVSFVIALAFLFFYPLKKTAAPAAKAEATSGNPVVFLRHYPHFGLFLLSLILIYYSHVILNSYTLQVLQERGGGSAEVGTATAIAAICELVTVVLFSRYLNKFSLSFLLRTSGIFFVLKNLATILSGSVPAFYLAQTMQMFAWGLICVGAVYFVNETIDVRDRAKGQSYAGMTLTVATVIGGFSGGWLIDTAGVQTLLWICLGICSLGALLMFPATGILRSSRK